MVTASISTRQFVRNSQGLLSIGDAAKLLGVSQQTLRSATDSGALRAFILPSGHRRFNLDDCYSWMGQGAESRSEEREIICYCRVSGARQSKGIAKGEQSDLSRQIERLIAYSAENYGV